MAEELTHTCACSREGVKDILADLTRAQGELDDGASNKALAKHLRTTLYPLLARALSVVDDVEQAFAAAIDELQAAPLTPDEYLIAENVSFVVGIMQAVKAHLSGLDGLAQNQEQAGDPTLVQELVGLWRGVDAVEQIVTAIGKVSEEKLHDDE